MSYLCTCMRQIRKNNSLLANISAVVGILLIPVLTFCTAKGSSKATPKITEILADTISHIVTEYPGEIGVAIIINDKDTVTVNDRSIYPMMSVFKLHQALAVCNNFDLRGADLDSVIFADRRRLDPETWSPMMKEHTEDRIVLSVRDLLHYILALSDNNASNLIFERLVSVEEADKYIATLIPRQSFRIAYTESEMSADHTKAYSNFTSPLGAVTLINRLFTEKLVSCEKQSFIKKALQERLVGQDRIVAPLSGKDGMMIAHKTGSGYRDENGILAAHNDVAYICFPDGFHYSLAVFVKDFDGDEAEASKAIARISGVVCALLGKDNS